MSQQQVALLASNTGTVLTAWDLDTGTQLASYKGNASQRNSLTLLGEEYFMAAQQTKGCIHFWTWQKEQVLQRCFAVEPIVALAASPDGAYCIGGGSSGYIYVWQTSTGALLRSWPAHYNSVRALAVTEDGAMLLSGGDDAVVNAWLMMDLLDDDSAGPAAAAAPAPHHTWSAHTLPVTALWLGAGGCNGIAVSASLDRTCKVCSLADGTLLRTEAFPVGIHSVAADPAETCVYAGGGDGRVFEVSLVGAHEGWIALEGHSLAVSCLAPSPDGERLLSGSEDGTARVWQLRSRQPLRVLATPAKGPITGALVLARPAHLALDAAPGTLGSGAAAPSVRSAGSGPSGGKGPKRVQPLAPLEKYTGAAGTGSTVQHGEGPHAVLDGSAGYRSLVQSCGLLTPPVFGTDLPQHGPAQEALSALEERNQCLEAELAEARKTASRWQRLHSELMQRVTSMLG